MRSAFVNTPTYSNDGDVGNAHFIEFIICFYLISRSMLLFLHWYLCLHDFDTIENCIGESRQDSSTFHSKPYFQKLFQNNFNSGI